MRYIVNFYKPQFRPWLIELAKNNPDFLNVPSDGYLRDIAICVWDIKKTQMVGFVCGIMGLSETIYASHLILDKSLRKTKNGNYVLKLLVNEFEEALRAVQKEGYDLFVDEQNKDAINFYNKRLNVKLIAKGILYHKKIGERNVFENNLT